MTVNRISGLAILLFALLLWFRIIPAHTETVGSGWLKPDTLPLATGGVLGLFGLTQICRPRGATEVNVGALTRIALVLVIVCGCLWLMSRFGFLVGSIPAVASLMVIGGERRAILIGVTSFAVPTIIWFLIVELLGRSLP